MPAEAAPIQPPLFAELPDTWRDDLVKQGYGFVNHDTRVRFDWQRKPTAYEIVDRLRGYALNQWGRAAPDYETVLQCAQSAVDHCNSTKEGYDQDRLDKAARGRETIRLRKVARDDQMLAARAAGRTVKEVAADFGVSTRTVMRAATPAAVAEHLQVTNAITPPLQDDCLKSGELTKNRYVSVSNGVWHLPAHWLIDAWTANVGMPTPAQSWQLLRWAEEVGDGAELPDVVRVIVYAGGAGNPWAYAVKAIPQYLGRPEWWQDLTRRASHKQRQYAEDAANPRGYLASCLSNARAAPPARLDADRGGYVDDVRRLYGGRLPWEASAG